MKSVDITTIIGCANMCKYCPQNVFLNSYKSNIKNLTVDNLKLMLNNINNKTTMLNFSGYSENFFNKDIAELLLLCYNSDFTINLFTTLEGFDDFILKKLSGNMKFNYVRFHEYDSETFDKNNFYMKVNKFIDNIEIKKEKTGMGYLDFNYEITKIYSPFSRANNNTNYKTPYKYGKLKCNFYETNLIYDVNQILPNGDIYLCCMDWSLKHKLGNIFNNHYDSDEINNKRIEIENLLSEEDSDVLCRNCEFSIKQS